METQTLLSRHKFISAENIIAVISVSSDDSSLPSQSSEYGVTVRIQKIK